MEKDRTWNVRGMNGKEIELRKEFKNLGILAIIKIKKKGCGKMTIEEHEILYSGVDTARVKQEWVVC